MVKHAKINVLLTGPGASPLLEHAANHGRQPLFVLHHPGPLHKIGPDGWVPVVNGDSGYIRRRKPGHGPSTLKEVKHNGN